MSGNDRKSAISGSKKNNRQRTKTTSSENNDRSKEGCSVFKIPKTYSGKIVLQTKEEIVHVTDVDFQGNLGISTNTGEILLEQDMN